MPEGMNGSAQTLLFQSIQMRNIPATTFWKSSVLIQTQTNQNNVNITGSFSAFIFSYIYFKKTQDMQSLVKVCPTCFYCCICKGRKISIRIHFQSKLLHWLFIHVKLRNSQCLLSTQLILFLLYLYICTLPIKRAYLPSVYITALNQRFRCFQERSDNSPSVQAEVYLTLHMYDLDNYSHTITKQQLPQSNGFYVLK